ncbi:MULTISPECIES: hypothetical protein [unclassified Methylophaga]|jgi:hypothetical protein|uniref:hypothetical protein n=1 Tax=unclassified Methylophaga TaxID=2629249 RepID=UPI0023B5B518|nr:MULTISPECIES: hypothetical protein [unclassified Methylophaga]|tara:strand:- start:2190 stop:2528 length:339 start_codon:yes stop_codon:yes gene_type:complete
MVYVERDETANIIAVYDNPQAGATEKLSVNSDELVAYLTQSENKADSLSALNASDLSLIRVLEDLINTLIDKQVILFTDLPLAAREKLATREKIRDKLNSLENLMSDDPGLL